MPGHPRRSFALAVERGRIAAIGSADDVHRTGGASATIESLEGGVVVPGFHDAHMHLSAGGVSLAEIDLGACNSEIEIVDRVRMTARHVPRGEWIRGRGWNQTDWAPPQWPNRRALDEFVPRHPVFLLRVDGHVAWLNGEALRYLGIDRETPDPDGGTIHRFPRTREPTGILMERAVDLAIDRLPAKSEEERTAGIERGLACLSSHGITSVEDIAEPWAVPIYDRLRKKGRLTARVSVWLPVDTDEKQANALRARHRRDAPDLTVATRKVFLDGTMGSRTAALSEAYADAPNERGTLRLDEADLAERVSDLDGRGWAIAFHAIGDRAVRQALDVVSTLESRKRERPHRIEHAQLVAPEDLPRFARLGVAVSMQPAHLDSDRRWLAKRLGPVRTRRAYGFRSLLECGATLALGTDWPVESPDPIRGLVAAARPRGPGGRREELSVAEALEAYTRGSALAAGDEAGRGALRAGYLADLVVLSEDPTRVPLDEMVARVQVLRTIVGGRTVYRKGEV